jgi:beta-phosphoglucomutase-like phosphatase (HAD superfamily)
MSDRFHQTPNWQPIAMLPVIAQLIDGGLSDTQEQYQTLQQAQGRSYALDDDTVGRVMKSANEQKEFLDVYAEQLTRWKAEKLSAAQKQEIERLEQQLVKFRELNTTILALVDQLKEQTIEKFLAKSDEEIALEFLLGKLNFP